MSILELTEIHRFHRPGVPVLNGVSLRLEPGEVCGLIGPNGSGKTTLVRTAIGSIRPQRGSVRLFGVDPLKEPVRARLRMGYVAEDQILPGHLRAGEVIALHRELYPSWDSTMEQRLRERFTIGADQRVSTLSKGQARQLALLCAMCHRPELLILDEPAGGLDPAMRRNFLETAIAFLHGEGATILFSSHQMEDVERIASRIVFLDEGRIVLDREVDELSRSFTLAVMPSNGRVDSRALLALEGCMRVRSRPGALHAVFQGEPDDIRGLLHERLGVADALCTPPPLEELFIEMVEGEA